MFSSLKSLISSITGLIIAVVVFYWAFSSLFPPEKKLTPERREAMARAAKQILAKIPKPQGRIMRLMVAPMGSDYTGEVSEYFRSALDAEGFFNVMPASTFDRVRKEMHLEPVAFIDIEGALKVARDAHCDQMLLGNVIRLSQEGSQVDAAIEVALYDVPSGSRVWTQVGKVITRNLIWDRSRAGEPFSWVGFAASIPGMILSVLASLLFAFFFALVLTPAIRRVLERESNGLNFVLLATLTLADAAAALLIMRRSFAGMAWIVLTLLIAVVTLWYNYWYCEVIDRKR